MSNSGASTTGSGPLKRKLGGGRWKRNQEAAAASQAEAVRKVKLASAEDALEREGRIQKHQSLSTKDFVGFWLRWPRQGNPVGETRLIPCKCLLNENWKDDICDENRFDSGMFIKYQRAKERRVGLILFIEHLSSASVLNTCAHGQTFCTSNDAQVLEDQGVRYMALRVGYPRPVVEIPAVQGTGNASASFIGADIIPTREEVKAFIGLVSTFLKNNPDHFVAVHCVSGFNVTGFFICCYLVEVQDFSVDAATQEFAASRPPGIFSVSLLRALYSRYDDATDEEAISMVNSLDIVVPQWAISGGIATEVPRPPKVCRRRTPSLLQQWIPSLVQVKSPHLDRISKIVVSLQGDAPASIADRPFLTQNVFGSTLSWADIRKSYRITWRTQPNCIRIFVLALPEGSFLVESLESIWNLPVIRFPLVKPGGSLLDGEVVQDSAGQERVSRFLVCDLVALDGSRLKDHMAHAQRLREASEKLCDPLQQHSGYRSQNVLRVRLKPMMKPQEIKKLLDVVIPSLPHDNDGIDLHCNHPRNVAHGLPEVLSWSSTASDVSKDELCDQLVKHKL